MRDQHFYGHGKLLLSGEYFVMDGAMALALPTSVGQSMKVKYRSSYQPTLNWKSFDHSGNMDVFFETKIEFPIEWGLGSSSTFIYNVAQWAYVSPFELVKKTIGGSGYDVACAQAMGPIRYHRADNKPQWESASFNPSFKDHIYFVYLGKKQSSMDEAIAFQEAKIEGRSQIVTEISHLTQEMISAQTLYTFNKIITTHEDVIASALGYEKAKDLYFKDFWGEIKSLGAWGGDFVMVTSDREPSETRDYFTSKGFSTFIPFNEIVRTDYHTERNA